MILHAREMGQGPPVALLHGLFGSARNLGVVQRALAPNWRAIALDMRNHGASPHAAATDYAAMAADVRETLAARDALPAVLIGHSMGGKAAMRLALETPEAVRALLVADIAPVAYRHDNTRVAEAMQAIPLTPGMTRAAADVALIDPVPDAGMRSFLLQNFVPGTAPEWRIGLAEIAAAMTDIEGWPESPQGAVYRGPALFVTGERSDYVRPEHRPAVRTLFPAARFVSIKRAGHWLHVDQPAAFVAVVEGFLAAVAGGASPA